MADAELDARETRRVELTATEEMVLAVIQHNPELHWVEDVHRAVNRLVLVAEDDIRTAVNKLFVLGYVKIDELRLRLTKQGEDAYLWLPF